MQTRAPTHEEIAALLAFLPVFRGEGFVPIPQWGGGAPDGQGGITFTWPEYDPAVREFFRLAGQPCFSDHDYRPEAAGAMLKDPVAIAAASLDQVKTLLTYCVRGERFSDGHWGSLIEEGHLQRVLDRLAVLAAART